jgi:creatinine amidohydrolase
MNLLDTPHARAREALASGAPVWLPINPIEYHGPHLSLRNDALLCAGLTRDLHRRISARWPTWPLLEACDLEIGVQPVPGPGSRAVTYQAAKRAIVLACGALAELGARRVVLATFHGSPLHGLAIEAGVRYLRARGVQAVAPFNLLLHRLLRTDSSCFSDAYQWVEDPSERRAMVAAFPYDFHAGFLETSFALHYAPQSVDPRYRDLPDCPVVTRDPVLKAASATAARLGRIWLSRELDIAACGTGWYALRPFPGYTGKPRLASAQSGALLARKFVDLIADDVADALDGRPPPFRPLAWWLPVLSLGGRWGGARAPMRAVRRGFPQAPRPPA